MILFFQNFLSDESGVTSVEYALLAAAASATVGVAGTAFYGKVGTALQSITLSAAPVGNGNDVGNGN